VFFRLSKILPYDAADAHTTRAPILSIEAGRVASCFGEVCMMQADAPRKNLRKNRSALSFNPKRLSSVE
jgi:hypothetical protein